MSKDTVLGYDYDNNEKPKLSIGKIILSIICLAVIGVSVFVMINKDKVQKQLVQNQLVDSQYWYEYIDCEDIEEYDPSLEQWADYEPSDRFAEIQMKFFEDGTGERLVIYSKYYKDSEGDVFWSEIEGETTPFTYSISSKKEIEITINGKSAILKNYYSDEFFTDDSLATVADLGVSQSKQWALYTRYE